MSESRLLKQKYINATELGLNGVVLNTNNDSEWIDCTGYSNLTLFIDHTNSAADRIDFFISTTNDVSGTPTAYKMTTASASSGTVTINRAEFQFAVSGDDAFVQPFDVTDLKYLRIEDLHGNSADGSDTATVTARLSVGG